MSVCVCVCVRACGPAPLAPACSWALTLVPLSYQHELIEFSFASFGWKTKNKEKWWDGKEKNSCLTLDFVRNSLLTMDKVKHGHHTSVRRHLQVVTHFLNTLDYYAPKWLTCLLFREEYGNEHQNTCLLPKNTLIYLLYGHGSTVSFCFAWLCSATSWNAPWTLPRPKQFRWNVTAQWRWRATDRRHDRWGIPLQARPHVICQFQVTPSVICNMKTSTLSNESLGGLKKKAKKNCIDWSKIIFIFEWNQ